MDRRDKQEPLAILTQPQAVVLSERFAQRYGFRLGSSVQIYTSQGIQQLVVRGLLRPEGVAEALGGHFAIWILPRLRYCSIGLDAWTVLTWCHARIFHSKRCKQRCSSGSDQGYRYGGHRRATRLWRRCSGRSTSTSQP